MKLLDFKARDGVKLSLLHLNHEAPRGAAIILHGSTYNSKRYTNLAKAIVRQGFEVLVPDWRGHGQSDGPRGHCQYIGQLEDDLEDLIKFYQSFGNAPIVLIGHSAGGTVILRYIDKYGCSEITAINLIAPAINGPLEAIRYAQAGAGLQYRISHFRKPPLPPQISDKALAQMQKFAPKLNPFRFWCAKFIPALRHRVALSFPANPQMAKLEGRVLDYSYNLMVSCDIRNYPQAFNKVSVPILIVNGEQDEILHPEFLSTAVSWHLNAELDKQLIELPNVNHMSVVNAAAAIVPKWLNERFCSLMSQGEVA